LEPGVLYDGEQRLTYLHWAGIKPEVAYKEIWEYYRYMYEPKPEPAKVSFWQQMWSNTKQKLKNVLKR
jgi:hypothetical protein